MNVMERTYEGFKKIINKIMESPYLIEYTVTNYKSIENGTSRGNITDQWDSEKHEYIVFANNKEDAESKFASLWGSKVSGLFPAPKLNIISSKNIEHGSSPSEDFSWGKFKNVLKFH